MRAMDDTKNGTSLAKLLMEKFGVVYYGFYE